MLHASGLEPTRNTSTLKIFSVCKKEQKKYFIKLGIEPNLDQKCVLTPTDFFEPEPELNP